MIDSSYLMLYYFSWRKKNKRCKCNKSNKSITINNSFYTDNNVKLFSVENDDLSIKHEDCYSPKSFDSDTTEKFFYYHDVYCK
jgi:hypothetical protein